MTNLYALNNSRTNQMDSSQMLVRILNLEEVCAIYEDLLLTPDSELKDTPANLMLKARELRKDVK